MEIVAIILSILALSLALYSLKETNKAKRQITMPLIEGIENKINGKYEFYICNKGNGLAKIKDIKYFWKFKQVNFQRLKVNISKTLYSGELHKHRIFDTNIKSGTTISIGDKIQIIKIVYPVDLSDKFKNCLNEDYGVIVKYSNEYGDELTYFSNSKLKSN